MAICTNSQPARLEIGQTLDDRLAIGRVQTTNITWQQQNGEIYREIFKKYQHEEPTAMPNVNKDAAG